MFWILFVVGIYLLFGCILWVWWHNYIIGVYV